MSNIFLAELILLKIRLINYISKIFELRYSVNSQSNIVLAANLNELIYQMDAIKSAYASIN